MFVFTEPMAQKFFRLVLARNTLVSAVISIGSQSVEGAAMTIGRMDAAFGVHVSTLLWKRDGGAAGKRHVAFALDQTLTGEMDCDQCGGTRCLHVDARPAQVQLVRRQCGHVVLI